jgi:uncharacterized protein (DUF433 family)
VVTSKLRVPSLICLSYTPAMSPITTDPEIMSGAPCFAGTRVPVALLFSLLAAGESVGDFLDGYPTVTREQVLAVLRDAQRHAEATAERAA